MSHDFDKWICVSSDFGGTAAAAGAGERMIPVSLLMRADRWNPL